MTPIGREVKLPYIPPTQRVGLTAAENRARLLALRAAESGPTPKRGKLVKASVPGHSKATSFGRGRGRKP